MNAELWNDVWIARSPPMIALPVHSDATEKGLIL